jgi:L-malate glycosyltransferase
VTPAMWRVLYRRGFWIRKLLFGAWGYLRRLRDLQRAKRFDFVYVHLWALPFGPPWFEEHLARRGVRLIYDIDDLIYLPHASAANRFVRTFRRGDWIVRIARAASHVIVATEHLRQFAAGANANATTISSTIDTDTYRPRRHSDARDEVTIGWSGSHSTAPFLKVIAPALQELSRRFKLRLLVVGTESFAIEGVHVEARPWSLERETADLAEMDIGVYPLPDEEWVFGKSGLKALQYMGVGVPVVASRIGAACDFIRDGDNGFLAGSHEEWVDRISRLILDPPLRARMGLAGRATVEAGFSVRRTAPAYLRVIAAVLARERPDGAMADLAARTRTSFGYEWTHFHRWQDSGEVSFRTYFETADLAALAGARVLDAGCGMGRHARQLAAHARQVIAVDFSRAIEQAAMNTREVGNVDCVQADLLRLPFPDGTFDYVYSLGVLHHLGNTESAVRSLVAALKPGGRLRVYMYWKRRGGVGAVLRLVSAVRPLTTRLPFRLLRWLCWTLSAAVWVAVILPYRLLAAAGVRGMARWPLFVYTKYPFRILYNDQFDRFSAPLEKRYESKEVSALLESAGLRDVRVDARFGWIAEGVKPAGEELCAG